MPYTGYNIATWCKFLLVKLETVAAKLYADRNIRHIKIKVLYVPLRVRFHCPSFGFFIVTLDYQVACTPTTISQVPLCTSTKQSDFLFWACITIISPLEFQPWHISISVASDSLNSKIERIGTTDKYLTPFRYLTVIAVLEPQSDDSLRNGNVLNTLYCWKERTAKEAKCVINMSTAIWINWA